MKHAMAVWRFHSNKGVHEWVKKEDVIDARSWARRLLKERDEARAVSHYYANRFIEERGEKLTAVKERDELREMVKQQIEENRKLVEQNTMLRGVLEQVEKVDTAIGMGGVEHICPWCGAELGHYPACPRQKVLGLSAG